MQHIDAGLQFEKFRGEVVTVPANDWFFVADMLTAPLRFWVVPMVCVEPTVSVKSGMVMTVPE